MRFRVLWWYLLRFRLGLHLGSYGNEVSLQISLNVQALCRIRSQQLLLISALSLLQPPLDSNANPIRYFIHLYQGLPYPGPNATKAELDAFTLPAWKKSLITSILSAGTFFGAIMAGDIADWIGRRTTIIIGCVVFMIGVGRPLIHFISRQELTLY